MKVLRPREWEMCQAEVRLPEGRMRVVKGKPILNREAAVRQVLRPREWEKVPEGRMRVVNGKPISA